MAKISGLGATIVVADSGGTGRTISDDITDFTISTPRAEQDVTGVDEFAHARLLLLADYTFVPKGVFNSAANMSHAVFATVPSTSVLRATSVYPTSNGSTPVLTANLYFSSYDITRAAGGELTWQANGALGDGNVPTWA